MKYAFIQQHRRLWPISMQCRVLQVSTAGHHAHLARRASAAQLRHLSDEALLVHIKALHAETRNAYDSPRTWLLHMTNCARPMPSRTTRCEA